MKHLRFSPIDNQIGNNKKLFWGLIKLEDFFGQNI